jgi:hypothetical protein
MTSTLISFYSAVMHLNDNPPEFADSDPRDLTEHEMFLRLLAALDGGSTFNAAYWLTALDQVSAGRAID